MGADHAGCDALPWEAEEEVGDEVEEAKNEAEDACCDDDSPERKTELLLRGSVLVEVPEHLTSHDDQSKCQGD